MKALQLKGIGKINIEDIPVPEAKNGRILMKVLSSALCRTDAKMWKMGHRDLVLPRILGHECCASRADTGKRHVIWPGNACGFCMQCKNGYENLCDHMQILGFHIDGCLAEYTVAAEANLIPVPDNLSNDLACLTEPLACCINALQTSGIRRKQKILIYGAGPVGLMMALAAKAREAIPTVCEINPDKINISRKFQNITGIEVTEKLPQDHWNTVINAAPSLNIFREGIRRLESGGSFCIFSGFTDNSGLDIKELIHTINEIHYRQLRISSAYGCTRQQMLLSMEMLRNHKDSFSHLIEKTITIEDVFEVLPQIWDGKALRYVVKFV